MHDRSQVSSAFISNGTTCTCPVRVDEHQASRLCQSLDSYSVESFLCW
jgi:hypothetical protein